MFSRKDQLLRKTGPDGIGRYDFLRLLKKEFEETTSEDSKIQTLANLANFAYDPINYDYIRSLNIIELFLEQLCTNNDNETLINHSIAAVCNLSSDPKNRDIILRKNGVTLIARYLYSPDEEVVLNVISTLMFLKTEISKSDILSPKIIDKIKEIKQKGSPRLVNISTIFLEDC